MAKLQATDLKSPSIHEVSTANILFQKVLEVSRNKFLFASNGS